jgi:hypothetical protein
MRELVSETSDRGDKEFCRGISRVLSEGRLKIFIMSRFVTLMRT